MKCPKCQFDNREGAKFCLECGEKFEIACSQCGKMLPPSAKFCDECGQKLGVAAKEIPKALTQDEKLEKIQKYLPKGIAEKILAQRDRIEGERKQVTVMFCDMEGFTPFADRFGPEETYTIMDQVYEILIHKVRDYEGTVNEMTGDGVMALFGAPIALEDAPQRAIRSALAIHREMARFSDKMKQEKPDMPPLKMRVGIHTGPVVVGTLGNDLRVEFKAVGDTVNLASRMESLAESGATYVTEETFKLTEGFFHYESLREKEVKGKEKPVNVYRVIGPSTRRTRFDVSAERGLTPFIGRERELELLLDGFERAKQGRGQALSIISEAGVGKSRLLYEFRKSVSNLDITFLEGKCLSYSRGVAYHPIIDLFKSNFDIREEDEDYKIKGKVISGLKQLGVDDSSYLPYLLELLSVKDSGFDLIPMSPEGRKDRLMETMIRIPLKGSEVRPLVVAIEDLHWIDKGSEDTLKYLLDSIAGYRIFLIFTYRPEFIHTWGGRSYHNQVNLNRLSNRESLQMVNYLLDTVEIHRELEDFILEKTEGVPFFIEEFIRSLKDLKIIERRDNQYVFAKDFLEMTIPSTIQDVIMARVDALPEGVREVIQIGSVVEREFSYELIKQVTGLSEQELLSRLSILKEAELLYERGIYPDTTYIFKHAMTYEAVYNSMLIRKKKKLHELIGNAIEEIHKENIEKHHGVLSQHFIESGNYSKASEHSKLAGKKAQKSASFKDAIEYAKKEIYCLERLPGTDVTQKKIIDARARLAGYNISLDHYVEAKEAVESIVDLAQQLDYQKRLPIIYAVMGTFSQWVEEDYSKAFRYLNEALKISEKVNDDTSLWFANFFLGIALSLNCEFEKGLGYFKTSLDSSLLINNPQIGIAYTKSAMSTFNYVFHGKIDLAYQTSRESLKMAQESGDIYLKGMAYSSYGMVCYFKGLFDEAENSILQALPFCEKTAQLGWGIWASGVLGHVYADTGKYKKAKEIYKKGISILERDRLFPFWINLWKLSVIRLNVLDDDKDIDLNEMFGYYKDIHTKIAKGWAARCVGDIFINIDDQHLHEAEDWVGKAVETNENYGMVWHLAQDHALYSKLYQRKGNPASARESLSKAIELFKECGADGWVERYEKEFASFS